MKRVIVWLILVSIFLLISFSFVPTNIWKYLFFLRAPLLMGLILVTLPIVAKGALSAMLKNLFVLQPNWQLTFVIVNSVIASMSVGLVAGTILTNTSESGIKNIPELWQYGSAIVLALPICWTTIVLSRNQRFQSQKTRRTRQLSVLAGVLISAFFIRFIDLIKDQLDVVGLFKNSPSLLKMVGWLADDSAMVKDGVITGAELQRNPELLGYIGLDGLKSGHLIEIAFLVTAIIIYVIIGIGLRPGARLNKKYEAPALAYLLILISIVTVCYGVMTFCFDRFQGIPIEVGLIGFSVCSYALLGTDHFYKLRRIPQSTDYRTIDDHSGNFTQVLQQRLQHQSHDRTLVVVCASGGGIQAAGWTAQVLTGLQQELGTSFTQAIGLISSVSGGSVGTMYYLDHFIDGTSADAEAPNAKGYPEERDLDRIFDASTKDSLDAVGWGLAYLDIWRFLGLPILHQQTDRGAIVEMDWQAEMKHGKAKARTLATWRQQIFKGEIPIPVFNATLVENGQRFLISPMTFLTEKPQESNYTDFNTLYRDYDMDVVTAARLSASFPYVTPISRPSCMPDQLSTQQKYHVADGGYFDNSGFVTASEWLDRLLERGNPVNIKRVMILQINAFPDAAAESQVKAGKGWFMATLGPLLTMFKVRGPLLSCRNKMEAELLKAKWQAKSIPIEHFEIFFPSKAEAPKFYDEDNQYRPPLSWKLTDGEKHAIRDAWNAIKDTRQDIQSIKKLWHQTWKMPKLT